MSSPLLSAFTPLDRRFCDAAFSNGVASMACPVEYATAPEDWSFG